MFDLKLTTLKYTVDVPQEDPSKPFLIEHGCCTEAQRVALKRAQALLSADYERDLAVIKEPLKKYKADDLIDVDERLQMTQYVEERTERFLDDLSDLLARFAAPHVVALHNVKSAGKAVTWDDKCLGELGVSREDVLKSLGLGGDSRRANLSALCTQIIDGLKAPEKND